jgi:hypothetical protein
MTSERSRCALSGCDIPVPAAEDGRPPRRYCSPEHHAEARDRARGELVTGDDAGRDLGDPLPPAARALLPVDALTGLPSTRERRRRRRISVPAAEHEEFTQWKKARATRARRARQLVVAVGVAGVLVAGGTFVFGDPAAWFDPDHTPRAVAAAGWESQARVALTSIDRQLDSISATEAVWDSQIAPLYVGTPEQVQALLARKTLLEQQRAALQSQLATTDQLGQARAALADLDQQLAQLAATLDALPAGRLSPDQLYVLNTLTARRDLLLQERGARQADVDRLQQGVAAAQLSPVPDPTDQTTPLTLQVLDLRDHPPAPPAPGQQAPPPVANLGDRRDPAILASGPAPSSRKPDAPARSNMGPDGSVTDAVTEPVRQVTAPVREVIEPAPRSGDSPSSSGGSEGGSSARKSSPPPAQDDSSPATSSSEPAFSAASTSDSSDSAPAPRSSGGSTSSEPTYYGMTTQQAYDLAMQSSPMARFVAGASGAPVG